MIDITGLIAIAGAFFIVTVSPGPATIAVATVSMSSGGKNGQIFGLGLSFGLASWGLVAATGMGAVLQGSNYLLTALKLLGGVYLLWLAYQSGRSAVQKVTIEQKIDANGRWFIRGLFLNLSNPKAVVAWMAALSMGMDKGDAAGQIVTALVICIGLGFLNYAGYALAFSRSQVMKGYRRFRRLIDGVVAGLFTLAGIGLIRSAFSR
ncbi:LysE family translocator [Parasulfitobacter algicola]|uniref:LysE family translocator n=1 Tax=Parasulfitobacter algicola TaxID=2614809 RepID=A0ABX2IX05_9RHOB|nr:LysE family translocator [Sulfitobacter algicola]NSX54984.1 LysE family translocator [Sulfitobacter algicola]